MSVIVIFGNSDCKKNSFEYETAEILGKSLASHGFDIATGGYDGVMKAALKGASGFHVQRIGITFESTNRAGNNYITQEMEVESYFERLLKLIEIGDAFVVLPGGTGTLLEFATVWALKERKLLNRPMIFIGEQWIEVIQTIGFYSEKSLDSSNLLINADSAESVINELLKYFKK